MSSMRKYLERELEEWVGITFTFENGGSHPKIRIQCGDASRFIPYSNTKVAHRGMLNKVTELRRSLRELGAHRKS